MKYFIVDGRLGKNAEVVTGKTGNKYVRFTLANTEYRNKEATTTWFDVTSTDPFIIEKLCPYLTKGKHVCVNGEFDMRDIVTVKNGKVYVNLRIKANSISFISTGTNNQNKESSAADKIEEFNPTAGLTPEPNPTPIAVQPAYTQTPVAQPTVAPVAQPTTPQPVVQPVPTAAPAMVTPDLGDDLPF